MGVEKGVEVGGGVGGKGGGKVGVVTRPLSPWGMSTK